jgi:hypothetical protein
LEAAESTLERSDRRIDLSFASAEGEPRCDGGPRTSCVPARADCVSAWSIWTSQIKGCNESCGLYGAAGWDYYGAFRSWFAGWSDGADTSSDDKSATDMALYFPASTPKPPESPTTVKLIPYYAWANRGLLRCRFRFLTRTLRAVGQLDLPNGFLFFRRGGRVFLQGVLRNCGIFSWCFCGEFVVECVVNMVA